MQLGSNDWLKFIQEIKPNFNNRSESNVKEQLLVKTPSKNTKKSTIKFNATEWRSQ